MCVFKSRFESQNGGQIKRQFSEKALLKLISSFSPTVASVRILVVVVVVVCELWLSNTKSLVRLFSLDWLFGTDFQYYWNHSLSSIHKGAWLHKSARNRKEVNSFFSFIQMTHLTKPVKWGLIAYRSRVIVQKKYI